MQPTTRPQSETVTVEMAACLLGIGRSSAYAAVRRGELPALKIGRRLVIRRATIERLLRDPEARPRLVSTGDGDR